MCVCVCQIQSFAVLSSLCAFFTPPHPTPVFWCTDRLSFGVNGFSCNPVCLICYSLLSLSGCSCLPGHSLASPSFLSPSPCSLSHLCIILSAFLHPPRGPCPFLFVHIVCYCYCPLPFVSVAFSLSALLPLSFSPLLVLHMWKHRPQYWL